MKHRQLNCDLFDYADVQRSPNVLAALEALAIENGTQARGAIFTRVEVVDFISIFRVETTGFQPVRFHLKSFGSSV